jgi:hypothetical protein
MDGQDKIDRCKSAAFQCRYGKQLMKNIVKLVIKLIDFAAYHI